ncbi:MAG: phosphatidate cytidylyltransferase [Roseicyclus sp.]|uniref:phosphatidate cytidylyltransferase n=1 Tax=Boseongicola sp. H5 TaxID=2763261 RepID=UPI001B03C1B0|nr:phosphatidate cytidylyltransferase [Boseongicola sp. H5]MBO6603524.1 phosphatidate cytidylyltransferase [Roseicyclus sp.]MBO6626723.1 phosphatidate cytidylyltransferase [Roseicyclus sp.]MBO6924056.1 phosphatidate cytidylyltransferase [Roseicyclus sp.]
MNFSRDSFSDLAVRMVTGVAMAIVGLAAVWAGGWWFIGLVLLIVGTLVWELVRMLGGGPRRAIALGGLAAGLLLAAKLLPVGLGLPLLLLASIAGIGFLDKNRTLYIMYTALIMFAGFGLLVHREDFGLTWMLWLVLVVAATDVLGYFAGRILGGPKFWPRVSPKKTWSGTVAGWVSAGIVGAAFMQTTGTGVELIGISVALSMASQMGDIAESAVKRRMGVKDSSTLLPGHGGVFDRFDGMLGAALLLLLVESLIVFPPPPL